MDPAIILNLNDQMLTGNGTIALVDGGSATATPANQTSWTDHANLRATLVYQQELLTRNQNKVVFTQSHAQRLVLLEVHP